MNRLSYQKFTLKLKNPFRLSYGTSETREAFWLRLENDEGWGEGTIPPYYRVDPGAMLACWDAAARCSAPFPDDPQEIAAWLPEGPAPARSALDIALHDRIARQQGLPMWKFLGLPQPRPMATSFTIAIDTPDEMARMARDIDDYPIIKIKLGSDDDVSRVAAIRAARPDAALRIDANAGWSRENALENIDAMRPFNLEMIEQPLPREDIDGMGWLQQHTDIPLVADESVQSMDDVVHLAAVGVKGINLKLMKVGGLGPAVEILRYARQAGLKIMLGCMIETSVGATTMAHLMGAADWIDLDSPILISNDPFNGIQFDRHAVVSLPDRPGIGVVRVEDAG